MYEITLEKLKNVHNDRLWFSMNLKLGRLYLELQEFSILRKLLDQLYHYCETPEGTKDESKATALLDIYCLDIQVE
jgi:COP9 signalosome complex subunit 2